MSSSASPSGASSAEYADGPMTPILIDISMITGLDVTSSANPMSLNTKNQYDFKTKSIRVMKVVNRPSVSEAEFPRLEPIVGDDEEERTHRRCTSYGKYASTPTDAGAKLSAELLKDWFCSFYEGFQKDARVWFLYEDSAQLEHPVDFKFEDINHEVYQSSREIFSAAISPCILPVGIHQGRNIQTSYEFYHPMSSARQLGMGQLPISLFFADKIQCRGGILSTLMMDRLLSLQGPPLGSIDNIELATFRSKSFDRWWESSSPHRSNSGKDIQYAPSLIPNGGGLSPPVIGYDAPKTSALLQGLTREPADAGKKRKTRSSAVDILAPAPNKKIKKKAKPADDLPALDPSIEQALDEEEIGEDVDQAVAEVSDIERTPSASPKQAPPTPSALVHFSRKKKTAVKKKSAATTSKPAPPPSPPPSPSAQQSSSDQTPSAAGSHHVEKEEQPAAPAIPVLADLFSFDIKDYLDEGEEDVTSKALAPLSDDVRKTLRSILDRLEASSLDSLVVDCGPIRARLHEIQALIPDELADVLTPAVYLEQHQYKLEKAKLRLAERPIKSNIDRLEARKIDLLAQLEECNAELDMERKKLVDLPQSIEEQKARLKSAIKHVAELTKSLKVIPGTDAQDAQAIEEVEQIRQQAISAIQQYLS
uniref:OSJNBa0094O15.11 protein n=1 Tax=Oryza sativa subsp. japonica TaxID=39947 RepID=Q7XXJ1_ORYSJ|nr:OSJNBa0094O15.11 [Oryza sativa Japonica Group]